MTPTKISTEFSHLEGVSDEARARELYKYFQPSAEPTSQAPEASRELNITSNVSSSKVSSPDTALTVFCQLTAWRLGCQRAMISLIDAENQYFIAESTRSLDLANNNIHAPGDELWLGCSRVNKSGRLCERTIAVAATNSQTYPHFIVNDLSIDEQFNTLPFVCGSPFLRRYVGVPLITKRGIPIGSLFVVDDRPGNGLTKENIMFLGTMAKTVMRHLELVREVEEHRRVMKMSQGISSFVERRVEVFEANNEKINADANTTGVSEKELSIHSVKSNDPVADLKKATSDNVLITSDIPERMDVKENKDTTQTEPTRKANKSTTLPLISERVYTSPENDTEDASIRSLFYRAAHLIQTACEMDGGTVFYDARTGSSESVSGRKSNLASCQSRIHSQMGSECSTSDDEPEPDKKQILKSQSISSTPYLDKRSPQNRGEFLYPKSVTSMNRRTEILGYSTSKYSSIHGDNFPGTHVFKPLRHKILQSLLRQYPRGKLWAFNIDGTDSSSEQNSKSEDIKSESRSKGGNVRVRSVVKYLSQHFPGARQLIFVPLWDAGRSRWFSGCFAWSKDPTRILSKQNELSFLTAFGNCVMAEWARIDTEIADQKKSDFIGSISHELRSPLHGILASVEFLEEVLTGWEKQLVETIESCGRTLLDTINHILDFSKISHFESHWRRTKRAKSRINHPMALEQSDMPMLNLFQEIDLSVICEEVIDSVYAGHVFQNITAQSFNQVADTQGKMSDSKMSSQYSKDDLKSPKYNVDIAVILDIDPQNYHVTTQPGALRRLIMNLLGNSLKYTSHGYIIIRLDCHDMEDLITTGPNGNEEIIPRSLLTFTVTDTGKGISPEFLRNKLFIPFAQENILSSGTGLGLSIVRAIVSLLEGDINIDSEVGQGTQVKVSIPVLRRVPHNPLNSEKDSKLVTTHPQVGIHQSVLDLRNLAAGQKVSLSGFDLSTEDPIINEQIRNMKASITNYIVNWYQMQVVSSAEKTDFIVAYAVKSSEISSLALQALKTHGNNPSIIVLCSQSSVLGRIHTISETSCKVGYITRPTGPVKLAKAMAQTFINTPAPSNVVADSQQTRRNKLDCDFRKLSVDGECEENTAIDEEPSSKYFENSNDSFQRPVLEHPDCTSLKLKRSKHTNSVITVPKNLNITESPNLRKKCKAPSILIVDDNHINLRLVGTYLGRRAYPCIDTALDGLEAVSKFEAFPGGYDIIFMDITMPKLDGFGATRRIRRIEMEMGLNTGTNTAKTPSESSRKLGRKPAIIIAFTGRSSTEDQNEAVRCGIDLFMTKPVPFREVGKICDNWIANQIQDDTDPM
ncbi:putative two-component sensor protein histidine protein kinase [Golovinomyces cichoracearum]|uniref:Putative two-component sensor protein histidine protein kinase n=1 Tax=Golovinomyces cichoracearum TaxID=62708 RepID=A0A420IEP9_9PEZI|nr:putative two-component sensor protein histidine protein kinase [Golovinomyces cichoracearum]